ncbi:MAG: hypothetical protein EOO38_32490 [Cytophagaceae bacterium]|nr:MAG: hypothetical protein EOO38_32490 [Cytophagaceae bacterium]
MSKITAVVQYEVSIYGNCKLWGCMLFTVAIRPAASIKAMVLWLLEYLHATYSRAHIAMQNIDHFSFTKAQTKLILNHRSEYQRMKLIVDN